MGHGSYSYSDSMLRASYKGYATKSTAQVFKQRSINNAMNPSGVTLRESRDSKDNPKTIPIILALDETGSMGTVPHFLVKEGLPKMMQKIIDSGVASPQVLFMGIGDHECDRSPLQIGQFESNDELLDKWLTDLYLEGGGGGNYGESYLLAWFFASKYTQTDHFEKRGKKGILFTIGDEPTLTSLPASVQKEIMGDGQYSKVSAAELLEAARKQYEVFHLHILETGAGRSKTTQAGWTQLMGDNVIFVQGKEQVAQVIADTVLGVVSAQGEETSVNPEVLPEVESTDSEEMML